MFFTIKKVITLCFFLLNTWIYKCMDNHIGTIKFDKATVQALSKVQD